MGNTRVMFAQTGKVLQDQSYYPFGMTMGASLTFQVEDQLPDNKYKYNGKELQDDFGLDWYDYGTRMYDPTIGRWNGIDAHAENYFSLSSYNYGLNNPIRMIDPDGMDAKDRDEGNIFFMNKYENPAIYGNSIGKVDDKTKGKTSNKGNDKKDDNSENNPNQGDPVKDHLLDVAAGNAPGNTFGSQVIGASYGNNGDGASSGVAANGGGGAWYSIYNWPALGSSARTMDALNAGNYFEATIQFLTCAAEVFTFGYASEIHLGTRSVVNAAKGGAFGEKLFLSERFGITSERFANSITGVKGSWNNQGGLFKMGWSTQSKYGGGMQLRIGIGRKVGNPKQAWKHFYVPKTFVPNSFANPSIQVKQFLFNLGL